MANKSRVIAAEAAAKNKAARLLECAVQISRLNQIEADFENEVLRSYDTSSIQSAMIALLQYQSALQDLRRAWDVYLAEVDACIPRGVIPVKPGQLALLSDGTTDLQVLFRPNGETKVCASSTASGESLEFSKVGDLNPGVVFNKPGEVDDELS
ncbi:MAG: hypothetical protein AAFY15_13350 [Cyanobacteria bacterium J06648_11]